MKLEDLNEATDPIKNIKAAIKKAVLVYANDYGYNRLEAREMVWEELQGFFEGEW